MDKFKKGASWVITVAAIVIGILLLIQGNIFGLVLICVGGGTGIVRLTSNERKRT